MKRKLTDSQVLEILASDELQKVLAHRYGVSKATISCVKTGQNHRHISGGSYRENKPHYAWHQPFHSRNFMPTERDRATQGERT